MMQRGMKDKRGWEYIFEKQWTRVRGQEAREDDSSVQSDECYDTKIPKCVLVELFGEFISR
jgi:hypothetical protein